MTKHKKRFMIIGNDLSVASAVSDVLLPHFEVTVVGSFKQAAEKAEQEKFDVIIAGCVVPSSVSGEVGLEELKDVDAIVAQEKASLLKKIRDSVQHDLMSLLEKRDVCEKLLLESRVRQDKIVELLEDHVRSLVHERAKLNEEVGTVKAKVVGLVKEKAFAEEKAEKAVEGKAAVEVELCRVREASGKSIDELGHEVESLMGKLKEALVLVEKALEGLAAAGEEVSRVRQESGKRIDELGHEVELLKGKLEEVNPRVEKALEGKAAAEAELGRVRQESGTRIDELGHEVESLKGELTEAIVLVEKALEGKATAEAELGRVMQEIGSVDELNAKIKSLRDDLVRAASIAEEALKKKAKAEEHLGRLQENWERSLSR